MPRRVGSDALDQRGDALADADAHRGDRALAAARFQRVHRGQRQARAGRAERMPERDRAAVRVHVLGVVRQAELAQHREALGGERLVQLDHVDVAELQAESLASSFSVAGAGPMPMMRGGTPAVAIATTRARGVRP